MDADEPVEAQLRIAIDPHEALPSPIYSNFMQASFTPEDMSLLFGYYALPLTPPETPQGVLDVVVRPMARVVLPLNIVRNLIALLQRQVDAYESNFGRIPDHPNPPPWMKEAEVK